MVVKFKNSIEGRNTAAIFDLLGHKKNCVIVDLLNCYLGLIGEKNLTSLTEDDHYRIATRLLNMKDHFLFVNGFPTTPFHQPMPYMYNAYPPQQTPVEHVLSTVDKKKTVTKAEKSKTASVQKLSTVDAQVDSFPKKAETTNEFANVSENNNSLVSDLQSFGISFDDM